MTLSLQEISDRLEIGDLIVDYSMAIDAKDWDALDRIFTDDAYIDYSAVGGASGTLREIKTFVEEGLAFFSAFQHLAATSKVVIDGDRATGRTICHNPMVIKGADGAPQKMMTVGLWYVDEYRRTPDGWRIASRVEELCYIDAPQ